MTASFCSCSRARSAREKVVGSGSKVLPSSMEDTFFFFLGLLKRILRFLRSRSAFSARSRSISSGVRL